jgi:exo-1,4-beta-D-glucosaminidase
MRHTLLLTVVAGSFLADPGVLSGAEDAGQVALRAGWRLESAARVDATGEAISKSGFDTSGWHAITVPNTVVGALVENGTYGDPYTGMNLRSIPGTTYPIGERFTLLPMPQDSPFRASWWYRKEFPLPDTHSGEALWLHFDGINYRANIWLNGTQIAGADEIAGVFRRYEFDISRLVQADGVNVLAVEVFAPEPHDLAIMWVDWNPTPADKNMGLWGDVYLTSNGPLALRNAHVITRLPLPSVDSARLTVTTEVLNTTPNAVTGHLYGTIGSIELRRTVDLAPGERKIIRFTTADTPGLAIAAPRLWWPYRLGAQEMYTLSLRADVDGSLSDSRSVRFGIHQMTSELTPEGHRLFRVNGQRVLIRGGGWASDMLLRPASRERLQAELRYVREMGLNTIRLEGKLESDEFYDLADEYGILVMPGWCCCDQWEKWNEWDDEDHRVAPASLRSQILRLRNHPSVLVWLNGSDFPPPAKVEKAYLDVLQELEWQKPVLSNATEAAGPLSGPSGVKMRGPYDYVPPSYWLEDDRHGGAFGFATETGPGPAVPPIDSLKKMLPKEHLWPIDEVWNYHAGGDEFKEMRLFNEALEARYGAATDVEDYARKAQALTYESQRAMFEAFGRNKYTSTGVIQWMLNNAWPSMIWHLYDYYLRPGGGYYGTKKACEPLHVQYSYDDRSVVVVNERAGAISGLNVSAEVVDLSLNTLFSRAVVVDVPPDGVRKAFVIPQIEALPTTYFIRLRATKASGHVSSENFYWLSSQEDELDWDATEWYYTPTKRHADLKALAQLAPTTLSVRATGAKSEGRLIVENTGETLAFQVHLQLIDPQSGQERLPVYWDDNYFSLFPGEAKEVRVRHATALREPSEVLLDAWNAPRVRASIP